jgi:hypothetical protein
MRAVFSSLVATALLIHAVMGCCWHHAHDALCSIRSSAEQALETGCCHHDQGEHGDQQQGQPSHAPCRGHSHCCQGLCTYLPAQKTQLDTLQSHVPLDFAAIVQATCDAHVSALFHIERTHETAAGPPLRLHLYHQILLI